MSASTTQVLAPKTPAPETLQDPRFTIRDRSGQHLLTYCPINRVGGMYTIASGRWQLQCGYSFPEFVVMLSLGGIELAESPDSHVWLESCNAGDASAQCAGSC